MVGQPDEGDEDQHVNETLHELAVVHGANAGNEPQDGGKTGMTSAAMGRRWCSNVSRARRHRVSHPRGQTLLAVNNTANIASAAAAHRLAARSAKCRCCDIRVLGAVAHISLLCREGSGSRMSSATRTPSSLSRL